MFEAFIMSDILQGIFASMSGSAIVESIKNLFKRNKKVELVASDPYFENTIKKLPPEIIDFDKDVGAVNEALRQRPIIKENFDNLTPGQKLMAGCAIVAMSELNSEALHEIKGLDEKIQTQLQQLTENHKNELKESEFSIVKHIQAKRAVSPGKIMVAAGSGVLVFYIGKGIVKWVIEKDVVNQVKDWIKKNPGKTIIIIGTTLIIGGVIVKKSGLLERFQRILKEKI